MKTTNSICFILRDLLSIHLKNAIILFLICVLIPFSDILSQVTIGMREAPATGALLQLKSISDVGNIGGINATQGLLLPRLNIKDIKEIVGTVEGVKEGEEEKYAGLIVYNTHKQETVNRICPGLHVWNGSSWKPVNDRQVRIPINTIAGPQDKLVDTRAGENYEYNTARFYSYRINPYACDDTGIEVIDAGIWMTENLRTKHTAIGTPLTLSLATSTDGKNYHYPQIMANDGSVKDNPTEWTPNQGLFYSWAAAWNDENMSIVNQGKDKVNELKVGIQGICPDGWHLPSDKEWSVLLDAVSAQPELYTLSGAPNISYEPTGLNNLGLALEITETNPAGTLLESWSKSAVQGGFAAPVAGRGFSGNVAAGVVDNYFRRAYYWTSSSAGPTSAHLYHFGPADQNKVLNNQFARGDNLLSVRCKQDKPIIIGYIAGYNKVLDINSISADKLTHLHYAFLDINENGEAVLPISSDVTNLTEITSLKKKNPGLKIIVSIGGHSRSTNFRLASSTITNRKKFAESVVSILLQYNLDGADLNWEFPETQDKENFTLLFKALKEEFVATTVSTQKNYLLVATGANYADFLRKTEMDKVQEYVDYVNVMTYDMPSTLVAMHHTNLYVSDKYSGNRSAQNSINAYMEAGVPITKLVLGVACYGQFYHLTDEATNGVGDPIVKNYGVRGYSYIKENLVNKDGFVRYWDNVAKAPYLYNSTLAIPRFITYDDEESVKEKCLYIKKNKLKGIMFWEYLSDPQEYLLDAMNKNL